MAGIFPVDVGPQYEGEVIRKGDMHVEFGGPNVKTKFELVTLKNADEVEDQKIEVIGPDIGEMQEGTSYPIALLIDVAGEKLALAEKTLPRGLRRREARENGDPQNDGGQDPRREPANPRPERPKLTRPRRPSPHPPPLSYPVFPDASPARRGRQERHPSTAPTPPPVIPPKQAKGRGDNPRPES